MYSLSTFNAITAHNVKIANRLIKGAIKLSVFSLLVFIELFCEKVLTSVLIYDMITMYNSTMGFLRAKTAKSAEKVQSSIPNWLIS